MYKVSTNVLTLEEAKRIKDRLKKAGISSTLRYRGIWRENTPQHPNHMK